MLSRGLYAALAACSLFFDGAAAVRHPQLRQQERARNVVREATRQKLSPRQVNSTTSSPKFLNNATQRKFHTAADLTECLVDCLKEFVVDSLPDVNFDLGEIYSGLIPIDSNDTSRALFFVFEPTVGAPTEDVTIWLNGGPGCSSLEGFFQENGRFLWQPGTFAPVENP